MNENEEIRYFKGRVIICMHPSSEVCRITFIKWWDSEHSEEFFFPLRSDSVKYDRLVATGEVTPAWSNTCSFFGFLSEKIWQDSGIISHSNILQKYAYVGLRCTNIDIHKFQHGTRVFFFIYSGDKAIAGGFCG